MATGADRTGRASRPGRSSDLTGDGFIEVQPTLQVVGHDTVFAIGDVSTADAKMAGAAHRQADVVVENIAALAAGRSDLASYQPVGPAIAVPIGPTGGAGQFPGREGIVGADVVSDLKGRDMMVDRFAQMFELDAARSIQV